MHSRKKKKCDKREEQYYDFDKYNPDDRDSAYDNLLTYNEVVGYINKTPPGHKDRVSSDYVVFLKYEYPHMIHTHYRYFLIGPNTSWYDYKILYIHHFLQRFTINSHIYILIL